MIGVHERFDELQSMLKTVSDAVGSDLRVSCPGTIVSFDPERQTAVVQPAIQENIKIEGEDRRQETLPQIPDVPVHFQRGGGYCMTFPIKKGDDCWLVFADRCIDAWWQSGGVQAQAESRSHDLSDPMAIVGLSSQPNIIKDYSEDSVRIRDDDNETYVDLKQGEVEIRSAKVTVDSPETHFKGKITVDDEAIIGGIAFTPHTHGNVEPGGGSSGPPEG